LQKAERSEKRKEVLPMAFNDGQLTLRAALISDAQRNNRLDEVTNLIKATSIPELQPHLAEMFSQLADKTGSPDRKKTKAEGEEVIKMVCNDDDDDDDDSLAASSVYSDHLGDGDDDLEFDEKYEDPNVFMLVDDAEIDG
jgi:hypothetical protein